MKKRIVIIMLVLISIVSVSGCAKDKVQVHNDKVALEEMPNIASNEKAYIDYTKANAGVVKVSYKEKFNKPLKAQVMCPNKVIYTYNLKDSGAEVVLPLSEGSGEYKVCVYENIENTSYITVLEATFEAEMGEFDTFLQANVYVDYDNDTLVVKKAKELVDKVSDDSEKIKLIYDYVVQNYSYDYEKTSVVESGYIPNLDEVFSEEKGICLDYASITTAMLRSVGVPTKLVVGFSGGKYHAWVMVYSREDYSINSAILLKKDSWNLLDTTFASNANNSAKILEYIGDNTNYEQKYVY